MLGKFEAPPVHTTLQSPHWFSPQVRPLPHPHASPGMTFSITKPKLITLLLSNRSRKWRPACLLKGMGPPTASLFMLLQHCRVKLQPGPVWWTQRFLLCSRPSIFTWLYSTWASEARLGSHVPPEAFPDIPISLPGLWALLCASIEREHLRTLMSMLAAQPRGKENWIPTTKLKYGLLCLLIIWQETQPYCKMGLWSIMVKCVEIQTRLLKFLFSP